jgi:hypothetical protein
MYHIVTPLGRYENLKKLHELLKPFNEFVIWHIITDEDHPFRLSSLDKWIKIHICPNSNLEFWERCNGSINWWLDTYSLNPEQYYCFLNDDDAYEPDFFQKLNLYKDKKDICIVSMERGYNTPGTGVRAHPTYKLFAHPSNMVVGGVGIEQIILKGKILKNYRIPLEVTGDGKFIAQVCANNNELVSYLPDICVWFNYLEKGRWTK